MLKTFTLILEGRDADGKVVTTIKAELPDELFSPEVAEHRVPIYGVAAVSALFDSMAEEVATTQ